MSQLDFNFISAVPTPPVIKWFNVTKAPSINSILNHGWGFDYTNPIKYSDIQVVKAWQYHCISNYLQRMSIEPKGYVWSRHRHIVPQMADLNRIEALNQIMKSRGLDKLYGIDISFKRA